MNKLEARIIIEDAGNYTEEEVEEVLEVYEAVQKHIGFEDKRRDNRFIVKFHDIFYYAPDKYNEDTFSSLFEAFCEDVYDNIMTQLYEKHIDIDSMLHPMYVGHYQAFIVDIPEITNKNAIDLAMRIYDEFNYEGATYVENYIYAVNILQDLEDNYMEYWLDFLELNEFMNKEIIEAIKKKCHKDIERRKATYTLAK